MPNTNHPHTPPSVSSSSALNTQHSALPSTPRGTPYAASWSPEWIAQVEAVENLLDRRICGAKTPTGKPCRMPPTTCCRSASPVVDARPYEHDSSSLPSPLGRGARGEGDESLLSSNSPLEGAHDASSDTACHGVADRRSRGRCNFHGGADLVGGQPGNQNAASHGLYTRGLRPCSPSCPLWDKCPLACQDVADLQPPDRPTCPYETHDYETAVQAYTHMLTPHDDHKSPALNITRDLSSSPPSKGGRGDVLPRCQTPLPPHLIELVQRVATLSVMVNRAAAAMREADVIDQTRISSANYNATYARPHAYLQAYLRLSSELRRYHAMLKEYTPKSAQTSRPEGKYLTVAELLSDLRAEHEAEDARNPPTKAAPLTQSTSSTSSTPSTPPNPSTAPDPTDSSQSSQSSHHSHHSPLVVPAESSALSPHHSLPSPPSALSTQSSPLASALDHLEARRYQQAITHYNHALDENPQLALPHYDKFQAIVTRVPPGPNRASLTPRVVYAEGKPHQIYGNRARAVDDPRSRLQT